MNIGIVIAVDRELKAFLESDFTVDEQIVNNHLVYHTIINNNHIYASRSGMGKIDASAVTQLLITKYDCSVILNFGVTGALKKNLKVSDLFVVKKVCNYELDTSSIDPVLPGQYLGYDDIYIPIDQELICLAKKVYPSLLDANVASSDKFVEKKEDKLRLANDFGCDICDMEIAAIARTCDINKVKCLSIKCISDTFDGDGSDFAKNIIASANKAFEVIKKIIYTL